MKRLFLLLTFSLVFVAAVSNVDPNSIKNVHIVWMNHLDVGFTIPDKTIPGYAINVINKYFKDYFPLAVQIARNLKSKYPNSNGPRLVYTAHPWLVANYLDCVNSGIPVSKSLNISLYCPNSSELTNFKNAVKEGDIAWHAFPFNAEVEMYDESMLSAALRISQRLSEKFGIRKPSTISQRDVPGTTRSIIPHLVKHGVKAMSIGVNGASATADIDKINIWREPSTGKEIYLLYHPGGYGGDSVEDAVMVPGSEHALIMHFNGDNEGPGSLEEVEQVWKLQQKQFPNAAIQASTWDQYIDTLEPFKSKLTVFKKEIGDTWIYGTPSDPLKTSYLRSFSRIRAKCISMGLCNVEDEKMVRFDRLLMKHGEHTWGVDVKTFLHDWINWDNTQFEAAKSGENYQTMIKSWIEQRSFQYAAMTALGKGHPLVPMLEKEMMEMLPIKPNVTGYLKVDSGDVQDCTNIMITFSKDGGINYLKDKVTGKVHANSRHQLGRFLYQTYDSNNFKKYLNTYGYAPEVEWFKLDFGKTNLSQSNEAKRSDSFPTLQSLYRKGDEFLLVLKMDNHLHTQVGAPSLLYVTLSVVSEQKKTQFRYKLSWFDKTPTRLPESLWFSFNPLPQSSSKGWMMNKLGYEVSPLEVVKNGSFHLHGVKNVRLDKFKFSSDDVSVVSPGKTTPFPIPLDRLDRLKEEGMSFCLYNNIWGTNYIMWYPYIEADAKSSFRFTAELLR